MPVVYKSSIYTLERISCFFSVMVHKKIQEVSYLLLWKTLPPLPPRVGAPLPLAAAVEKRKQYMHLEIGVIHNI